MTTDSAANDPPVPSRRRAWLLGFVLALGTLASYWPVQHYDYVNLDDPIYVYQAPLVQAGITSPGFKWAFTNVEGGNWNPLVWLSHMLDTQMFGPEAGAGGRHVTNVLLHVANVLLLFALLLRMTGAAWPSAFAAALFAWHPLHVESVAWISERKDVLSTLFWLLTMWAYVRYARELKIRNVKCKIYYALALVFFVLGLMSKPMLVTLPLVLLIMDWWPLGRIANSGFRIAESESSTSSVTSQVSLVRALMEKIPFFALSAGASIVAVLAQKKVQAMGAQGLVLRLENAATSCTAYVGQFFWPAKLAVTYPYPETIAVWRVIAAVLILLIITLGVISTRRKRPYLAAGWLWFLVTLLPVIGLVQVGMQSMADRYTYVPCIGLGLMISWGLADLAARGTPWRALSVVVAVVGLAACVMVTMTQVTYWRNSRTLYEHALAVTQGNLIAHGNLGDVLEEEGDLSGAVREFEEEIRLKPNMAKPYNNLGKAFALQTNIIKAGEMFSNAVRLDPGFAQARRNLGTALLQQGRVEAGLAEMKAGAALEPQNVDAHQKVAEALINYGKASEATAYCEMVVKARPGDAHARYMLGEIWLAQKHYEEAIENFKEAMRLAPKAPPVMNALAWIYATCPKPELRNGTEAVRLAESSCELSQHHSAEFLDTLAAAYAEAGRFPDAVKTAEETRVVAEDSHDKKTADTERQRLDLYWAGKAYHEEP